MIPTMAAILKNQNLLKYKMHLLDANFHPYTETNKFLKCKNKP